MATLSINSVRKSFGAVEVLNNIDIEVEDGGFLVLLGPSGCGKSTLLSIIAGLETSSGGDIVIGERNVNDVHPKDRNIAMVFQSYALYPTMSVRRNIGFGLEMRKVDDKERDAAVDRAADLLQIRHLLDRKPGQLSGGQRQRVAMGRAIVRNPDLFLFALMLTTSQGSRTWPVGLQLMVGEFQLPWGMLAAGGMISILPVIVLFAIVQRAMVAGLTAGAVKG